MPQKIKPQVAADCVVFTLIEESPHVLLIQRNKMPFKDKWALPGGFLEERETIEETAVRELEEETGVSKIYLEIFGCYSHPKRDPRGPVVSVSFFALISSDQLKLHSEGDATDAKWFDLNKIPPLAFDHKTILNDGLNKLREKIKHYPIIFEILPKEFTMGELQKALEEFLGCAIDKRNFRKKLLKENYVIGTGKKLSGRQNRPAQLFILNKEKVNSLSSDDLFKW